MATLVSPTPPWLTTVTPSSSPSWNGPKNPTRLSWGFSTPSAALATSSMGKNPSKCQGSTGGEDLGARGLGGEDLGATGLGGEDLGARGLRFWSLKQ